MSDPRNAEETASEVPDAGDSPAVDDVDPEAGTDDTGTPVENPSG